MPCVTGFSYFENIKWKVFNLKTPTNTIFIHQLCGNDYKFTKYTFLLKWKCIFLLVPYINYQGQKLTKSKKYISNNDFSTGIGEGTSHHSNSIITVAGINNNMKMYKTINRASAVFNQTLQTQRCYQICRLSLMLSWL